jgi:hypothetical protein
MHEPTSHGIRSVRQTIWSSMLYQRARRIVADLTRPVRRIELGLIFRQDLTGPINLFDADVDIEIAQASAEEIERASSLNPSGSRSEIFRWRVQNGCVCFIARAGSTLVAYNWVRLRPGVDDGDMLALAEGEQLVDASHRPARARLRYRGSAGCGSRPTRRGAPVRCQRCRGRRQNRSVSSA